MRSDGPHIRPRKSGAAVLADPCVVPRPWWPTERQDGMAATVFGGPGERSQRFEAQQALVEQP